MSTNEQIVSSKHTEEDQISNPLLRFKSEKNHTESYSRECSIMRSGHPEHWACLKEACVAAGARWDEEEKSCKCPNALAFSGNAEPAAECLRPDETTGIRFYSGPETKFSLTDSHLSNAVLEKIWGSLPRKQSVIYNSPVQSATVFADLTARSNIEFEIVLKSQLQTSLRSEFQNFVPLVIVDNEKEISAYLSNSKSSAVDSDPRIDSSSISTAFRYFSKNRKEIESSAEIQSANKLGCLGDCLLISRFEIGDLHVQWRKDYVAGSAVRAQLLMAKADAPARFNRIIQLDPIGRVNIIFEREFLKRGDAILISTRAMNKHGETILTFEESITKESSRTIEALESQSSGQVNSGTVLVCEDGINLNSATAVGRFAWLSPQFRFGPYRSKSADQGGSVFGWLENAGRSHQAYYTGVDPTGFDEGFDAEPTLHDPMADHMTAMMSEIVGKYKDQLSLIPMHFSDCTASYSEWSHVLPVDGGPRVVNVSMGEDLLSSDMCEGSLWTRAIDASSDRFLWILASPNFAARVHQDLHCPTSLIGRKNVLVVTPYADGDPEQIDADRTQGEATVDIAVDGHNIDGGVSGSSAAARTSQIAALIAVAHPELMPSEIKLALILGINKSYVDVREHGSLVPSKALHVAQVIAKLKVDGMPVDEQAVRNFLSIETN